MDRLRAETGADPLAGPDAALEASEPDDSETPPGSDAGVVPTVDDEERRLASDEQPGGERGD